MDLIAKYFEAKTARERELIWSAAPMWLKQAITERYRLLKQNKYANLN